MIGPLIKTTSAERRFSRKFVFPEGFGGAKREERRKIFEKGKKSQKKSCGRRVRFLKKGAEFGNNFYILSEYGQKSRPQKRLFG